LPRGEDHQGSLVGRRKLESETHTQKKRVRGVDAGKGSVATGRGERSKNKKFGQRKKRNVSNSLEGTFQKNNQ